MSVRGGEESPYLCLQVIQGQVRVDGIHSYEAGHPLIGNDEAVAEGVYCTWNWDGVSIEVETCRFGLNPLFYVSEPGLFCISNSLAELLKRTNSLELDDDAIAVFLRIGFFLEDDTPFRNIKVVPPLAQWRWTLAGGLVRGTRPYVNSSRCAPSREARLDDYVSLFRQSMYRRRPTGEVLLPLSGGRDSRHILFELTRARREHAPSLECISSQFPPTRSLEDVRIAGNLCRALGLRHRVVPQPRSYVSSALRKNELTSFCSDEHTWAVPMCDVINGADSTVYDGLGGDVLSAGLFSSRERLKSLRMGRKEQFVVDLFESAESELQIWLRPSALQRFSRERAIARAAAAVSPHVDQANPIASFFFKNRTRREIALYSCHMIRPDMRVHLPYLDHALFDYLTSIPGEDLDDKTFHTDAIVRAFPQSAKFPYGLGDDDDGAARLPLAFRRQWNSQLAFDSAGYLMRSRDEWVDRWAVIPRLWKLLGAADTKTRFWMSIEKILWATQLERTAGPAEDQPSRWKRGPERSSIRAGYSAEPAASADKSGKKPVSTSLP